MTSIKRMSLALVLTVTGFGTAGAQIVASSASGDLNGQTLSPGDQLRIVVWRKPELTCDCVIAGNGTVIHPLYREVAVTGVPMATVEERLRTFLAKYEQNPQFVIQPLVKIIVRGEVRIPTIYTVPPETTIAQAIVLAGGPTEVGRLDQIIVIRDRQQIKIDLSRPDADATLLQVRSNDQIIVGRKRPSPLQYVSPIASSLGLMLTLITLFRR